MIPSTALDRMVVGFARFSDRLYVVFRGGVIARINVAKGEYKVVRNKWAKSDILSYVTWLRRPIPLSTLLRELQGEVGA